MLLLVRIENPHITLLAGSHLDEVQGMTDQSRPIRDIARDDVFIRNPAEEQPDEGLRDTEAGSTKLGLQLVENRLYNGVFVGHEVQP